MSNRFPPHETSVQAFVQKDTTLRTHRPTHLGEPRTPLANRSGGADVVEMPLRARRPDWQKLAVEEYDRLLPTRRLELRADFVDRLLALTGHLIPLTSVHMDNDARMAIAKQDGSLFRLDDRGRLVLLRPCAYCGTGQFESPEIHRPGNLGYAVSHWTPVHEGCGDDTSEHSADL